MNMKINAIIDSLSKNPWLAVSSFIITILSIILCIVFYYKGKRIKSLKTVIRSINLFKDNGNKIDGLEILYSKSAVPNVTITKIAFWNNGNETIDGSDIANRDPLTIKIKDEFTILESKMIYEKNKSNNIQLRNIEDGKIIEVKFDYLDNKEGGVVQILHTGNSSSEIEVSGTIKGLGKINIKSRTKKKKHLILKYIYDDNVINYILIILGIFFFIIGILSSFNDNKILLLNENKTKSFISYLMMSFLYLILGCLFIKRRVPKGFEIFDENI
ncbi:hypothetical protein ACYJ2V_000215 [Clostridium botulinum]|uniref:hypothetical protein n=1 Tax=Clostridium botulinum TaxID=1491 RepID=UPI000C764AA0|nr:hypothetical protein [Clostridium botulinum]AUM88309.1 hypothetical protein RSJ15_11585 [Clostridium botulinum]MCJ8173208.1 hypothetical protein [Clostridium botulinum]